MTIRIAILAVCASTLAFAATTGAFAASKGKGRTPGLHITDNESPRPQDRKTYKAGSGKAQPFNSGQLRSRMSANEASASGALKNRAQKPTNTYQSKTTKQGTGTIRLETVGSPLKRN